MITEDHLEQLAPTRFHETGWSCLSEERAAPPALPARMAPKNAAEDGRAPSYQDIPGLCKCATLAEIAAHCHVLTPGRCVGAEEVEGDGEPFDDRMARLVAELNGQPVESAKLEKAIKANLSGLGFEREGKV